MFCPYCGQQIADGAGFCTACGNPLGVAYQQQPPVQQIPYQPAQPQPNDDFQNQKNAIRDSELSALSNAWNYFSQARFKFQEYDQACKKLMHYARGAKSALIVWGSIALGIGLLFVLGFIADSNARGSILESSLPFICLFGIPGLLMIGGGILMKVNNRKQLKKYQDQYLQLTQELYCIYASYPNCPIGMEYSDPDTIVYMIKLIQSGRAYTICDSLNLLLGDRARQIKRYMEQMMHTVRKLNIQGNPPIFLPGELFKF